MPGKGHGGGKKGSGGGAVNQINPGGASMISIGNTGVNISTSN